MVKETYIVTLTGSFEVYRTEILLQSHSWTTSPSLPCNGARSHDLNSSQWNVSRSDAPIPGVRTVVRSHGKAKTFHPTEEIVHQPETLATLMHGE